MLLLQFALCMVIVASISPLKVQKRSYFPVPEEDEETPQVPATQHGSSPQAPSPVISGPRHPIPSPQDKTFTELTQQQPRRPETGFFVSGQPESLFPSQPQPQQPLYQPRSQPQPQQPTYQPRPQPQPEQPLYQPRPQPQPQQPTYQPRPQPQPEQPLYQPRPQPQPQQPTYQPRPQPQPEQPLYQPRPQPQPTYQPRPQPQQPVYQPQPQQPTYQPRPQPQPRPYSGSFASGQPEQPQRPQQGSFASGQPDRSFGGVVPDAEPVSAPIVSSFSCDNRPYGYYADEDNNCDVYHHCNPMTLSDGTVVFQQYSHYCSPGTKFSQEKLVCVHPREAIACNLSPNYYSVNERFGEIIKAVPQGGGPSGVDLRPFQPSFPQQPISGSFISGQPSRPHAPQTGSGNFISGQPQQPFRPSRPQSPQTGSFVSGGPSQPDEGPIHTGY